MYASQAVRSPALSSTIISVRSLSHLMRNWSKSCRTASKKAKFHQHMESTKKPFARFTYTSSVPCRRQGAFSHLLLSNSSLSQFLDNLTIHTTATQITVENHTLACTVKIRAARCDKPIVQRHCSISA